MGRLLRWIKGFIRELRHRRVIRVAVVYGGTAFVILQLGEILVDLFGLGNWILRLITLLLVLGFPLAMGLAMFPSPRVSMLEADVRRGLRRDRAGRPPRFLR